jgi:hypothetical protein
MRSDFGKAGKDLAERRHALSAMVNAHVDLYQRLADDNKLSSAGKAW